MIRQAGTAGLDSSRNLHSAGDHRGRPARSQTALAGWVICAAMVLLASGCAGGKMTRIENAAKFEQLISASNQPMLVDFYKGGCPTCAILDPKMDQLAVEFQGRVMVAKFMLMTPVFTVTAPELKNKFDINFYPTVILFLNGEVLNRFVTDYDIEDYRAAMNAAIGRAAARPVPPKGSTIPPRGH